MTKAMGEILAWDGRIFRVGTAVRQEWQSSLGTTHQSFGVVAGLISASLVIVDWDGGRRLTEPTEYLEIIEPIHPLMAAALEPFRP